MRSTRVLLLMVISGMLSACDSLPRKDSAGIQVSFEQLGVESATRSTVQGLDVRTAFSVTGLSLPTVVGQNVMSPGQDRPDLMAIPIAGMCSKIVVTSYETDAEMTDVSNIKNQLDAIQQQAIKVLDLQMRKQFAEMAVGLSQSGGGKEQLDTLIKVLGVAGSSAADFQAAQQTITSALDSETRALQTILSNVKTAASKSGVMVARWSSAKQDDTKFAIGSLLGAEKSGSKATAGYVVIAGIRDASLQIGTDFITRLAVEYADAAEAIDVENIFDSPYIEIFSRSAKYIAYSEQLDASAAFNMALKVTPQDIESLLGSGSYKLLLKQQQFTLDSINAAVLSVSNQGMFSKAKTEVYPYVFWPRPARAKAQDLERIRRNGNDGKGWKDVYSNRATLMSLKSRFARYGKNVVEKAKEINDCSYWVPQTGPYETKTPADLGNEFCVPTRDSVDNNPKDWRLWMPTERCMNFSKDMLIEEKS